MRITREQHVLPNGPAVFGLLTQATIDALRAGVNPNSALPSTYRTARVVSEEPAPLYVAHVRAEPGDTP